MSAELVEDRSYKALCRRLGPTHPYNARSIEILEWHDGPIVEIVKTRGDPRPRLELMIDSRHEGEGEATVHIGLRHQLVFDRDETLRATLQNGTIPTAESYRLAEEIVRYVTRMTRIGHPAPAYRIETQTLTWQDLPANEAWTNSPGPGPDGLAAPAAAKTRRKR